jgi:hypothetical protein
VSLSRRTDGGRGHVLRGQRVGGVRSPVRIKTDATTAVNEDANTDGDAEPTR